MATLAFGTATEEIGSSARPPQDPNLLDCQYPASIENEMHSTERQPCPLLCIRELLWQND